MSVARITEVSASSSKGFEKAIRNGIKRATETLQNVTGAWVESQKVTVRNGEIDQYRVVIKVTFILN